MCNSTQFSVIFPLTIVVIYLAISAIFALLPALREKKYSEAKRAALLKKLKKSSKSF